MTPTKLVNGERVEVTPQEAADRVADEALAQQASAAADLARQNLETRRRAALAKVTIALGITEEEFTDAVRYVLGN